MDRDQACAEPVTTAIPVPVGVAVRRQVVSERTDRGLAQQVPGKPEPVAAARVVAAEQETPSVPAALRSKAAGDDHRYPSAAATDRRAFGFATK